MTYPTTARPCSLGRAGRQQSRRRPAFWPSRLVWRRSACTKKTNNVSKSDRPGDVGAYFSCHWILGFDPGSFDAQCATSAVENFKPAPAITRSPLEIPSQESSSVTRREKIGCTQLLRPESIQSVENSGRCKCPNLAMCMRANATQIPLECCGAGKDLHPSHAGEKLDDPMVSYGT